ncbi:MAG TPA: UvrD-helicase domain-containing protein [Phycisphaerales bacterium]|nr:UvrD-helicase domain-containing protein [Phycisphaerales bacterium]
MHDGPTSHDTHDAFAGDLTPSWLSSGPVHIEPPHEGASAGGREPGQRAHAHARVDPASLTDGLTEPQKLAVVTTEGPVLVLAAAGSGKTRVITRRIAYLINVLGIPPWQVLALTFTNKAAGEMRERVTHILGGHDSRQMRGLTVTTFHSLCARLLRRYATAAGLKEDFSIYDSGDQSSLVKKVIEQCQLSTSNFPPRSVLSAISNAKNQLMGPSEYAAQAMDFSSRNIAKIYVGYEKALRAANAVDFDDLLLLTARMLKEKQEVRDELRERWQYVMVDEYQDTNKAQFVIASLIAGDGVKTPGSENRGTQARVANICVVGDPDQAIYGWRGADISNILDFEHHYPGCKTIPLGENFRSTAPILAVADTLIRNNKRRKHKDLFTKKAGGDYVEAVLCRDERHEARLVTDWMKRLHEASHGVTKSLAWKDMAVFYRTNALSRVLEEAFREANIPYTIARGTAFYDREEVKNAIGYLRIVANAADDVSLERVINTPARGISDATVDKLQLEATRAGVPLLAMCKRVDPSWAAADMLNARAVASVQKFVQTYDAWTGAGTFLGATVSGSLADLVDRVIKESGIEEMYRKQAAQSKSETDEERLDNLAELVSSARQFELEYDPTSDAAMDIPTRSTSTPPLLALLRAYLESIALVADADAVDPSQGSVTLMTLHAAKGLEFPAVAMVGMEEGLLPHSRAVTSPTDAEMEEERRLCFVGITRAMQRLMMTAAKYRTMRGTPERTVPSRFLAELPQQHLRISDQSDTFAELGAEWDEGRGEDVEFGAGRPARPSRPAPGPSAPRAATGLAAQFPAGCTVRHPQFGLGTVKSVSPGAQARAVIEFREVGSKTLVLEYARLTRVG